MTKLDIIRKAKSLFMKWRLHGITEPFAGLLLNTYHMSKLSKWRRNTKVNGYNDWYQGTWDYNRRLIFTRISATRSSCRIRRSIILNLEYAEAILLNGGWNITAILNQSSLDLIRLKDYRKLWSVCKRHDGGCA